MHGNSETTKVLNPTRLFLVYGLMAFGLGLNYVFNVIVARLLGAGDYGTFSLALTLFNTAALLAVLSLDNAALRFLPPLIRAGNSIGAARVKFDIYIAALASSVIFGFGLFLLSGWISSTVFDNRQLVVLLRCFSLAVPLFVLTTLMTAILQAHDVLGPRMIVRYFAEPITRAALAVALFMLGLNTLAPVLGITASLLSSALIFLVWQSIAFRVSPLHSSSSQTRRILGFCLPIFAGSTFVVIAARLDVFFVGALLDSHSVGTYAAALQTAATLSIVLQGVEAVVTTRFSQLCAPQERVHLETAYKSALRWTVLVGTPLALILIFSPGQVLGLFGEEYLDAVPALRILAFAQYVNLITGSANALLMVAGHSRIIMFNNLLYSLALLVTVSVGTKLYGIIGAAIGVAIPLILLNVTRVLQVRRLLGCHPYSPYLVKVCMAFVLASLLGELFVDDSSILSFIVYPGLFVLSILVLGLHPDDKKVLRLSKSAIYND